MYFDRLREKMTPANQRVYHNQAQLAHHPDPGYVRYKLFQTKSSAREDMMMDLVQSIQAAHADGFSYSDMAILTRKGRKETAPIAEALKAHGIPMNTHDSFLLSLSAKVRTVMAYLSFLAKPSEVYFRFDLLRSLSEIEGLSFDLTQAIDACMITTTKDDVEYRRLGAIESFISSWNPVVKTRWETGLSAYDLAKSFIDDLELGMDEYLEFLLDQLSQKSTIWGFYPAEVITWWSKAKEKLCIQSNVSDDAIRIMTIHRSKGLEFPVVFYPRFQSKNPSQNIWVPMDVSGIPLKDVYLRFGASEPKHYQPHAFVEEYNNQLLDQFNLMYVAQTRAEERLYIFQEEIESDDTKTGEEATINDTLFTQTFKEVFESLGSDTSTQTWELGNPEQHKSTTAVSAVEIRSLRTQGKAKKVKIRFSATQRNEGHDHWLARKRGDRTHRFLQLMLIHRDAQMAMEMFESQFGPIEQDERLKWSAVLSDSEWNNLVLSKAHQTWRIEQSLLLSAGKELRPDAYRVLDDCIELIDFKTGKEMAEHLGQIDDYSKVLFDIWKMPIKGMLYYTENQKWIRSTYQGHLF
jgi:ATP-dependent exoDNAse (exonuclease V) beta subunit